jgi:hypothetical protein
MTQTESIETEPTTLELNRATGTLVPASPVFTTGTGAALAKFAGEQKKTDRVSVNSAPAEKESNVIDLTVIDNITGATTDINGTSTVGLDNPDAIITQKLGTKSLALLLLMNNNTITAENITAQMKESLINGDVATQARLLGIDFDSAKFEAAELLLKSITNDTRGMKAGRQQFTATKV